MLTRDGAITDPIPDWIFRRGRFVANLPVLQEIGKAMTASTGRPRGHTWEVLFALLAIAAIQRRGKVVLADAKRTANVLTPEQAEELRLGSRVTYRQVELAVTDLAAGFHWRVNHVTGEARPPRIPMSPDTFTTRLAAEVLPRKLRRAKTIALDSTDAESHFARQSWTPGKTSDAVDGALPESEVELPKKQVNKNGYPFMGADGRYIHCKDPEVREGYRSGKNLGKKELFLGMDLHVATAVPEQGADGFAGLILGVVVRPAGSGKGEAGITLLDSLNEAGMTAKTVLADRGYSYLKAENWADQLMERGIEQFLDLHKNQRMVYPGPKDGTVWVDGSLFVDSLPKRLRKLSGFHHSQSAERKAELTALYDAREPYAFKPLGTPDLSGKKQRVRGPAADGRLRCPNHPKSMRLDPATHPTTNCTPRACSCASAPTLGPDDLTRERQRARFGTTKWHQSYGRRAGIESVNASLKKHHSRLDRHSTQVLGTTRTTILLGFIIAAANIEILKSCYGFDPGLPHAKDIDVRPLPTASKALHRKTRPFAHRNRRSPVQPNGPPRTHPDWEQANLPRENKETPT